VLAIQQQLPRARVVYCSATGVSEARALELSSASLGVPARAAGRAAYTLLGEQARVLPHRRVQAVRPGTPGLRHERPLRVSVE